MSSPSKNTDSSWRDWPVDREIVLSRVIDAPRSVVFAAWADPHQIETWFGPEGMVIETKAIDLLQGGGWRFDMVAPDGTLLDAFADPDYRVLQEPADVVAAIRRHVGG